MNIGENVDLEVMFNLSSRDFKAESCFEKYMLTQQIIEESLKTGSGDVNGQKKDAYQPIVDDISNSEMG